MSDMLVLSLYPLLSKLFLNLWILCHFYLWIIPSIIVSICINEFLYSFKHHFSYLVFIPSYSSIIPHQVLSIHTYLSHYALKHYDLLWSPFISKYEAIFSIPNLSSRGISFMHGLIFVPTFGTFSSLYVFFNAVYFSLDWTMSTITSPQQFLIHVHS